MGRPKRNGVTGCWRKLDNEELHNLYSTKYDKMHCYEMGEVYSTHGGDGKCFQNFDWKDWGEESTRKI
jgi:hypothetical protein